MTYTPHPVAALFPMIPEGSKDWNDLVESVTDLGIIDPIVIDGDVLLDGRNRLRICESLGIKPRFVQWSNLGIRIRQDEWIAAKNLDRRNLTEDQKAQIGFEINRWQMQQEARESKAASDGRPRNKKGQLTPAETDSSPLVSKDERSTVGKIAEAAGVSYHKVRQALKLVQAIEENKIPASVQGDVKSGKTTLTNALKPIGAPKPKLSIPEQVAKKWKAFLKSFDEADHSQVKKILKELIK